MKILFITHDIGLYGASRSLQLLTNQLSSEKLDLSLIVNKRLFRKNNLAKVSSDFGIKESKIKQFHLPFDPCEIGKAKWSLYYFLKQLVWHFDSYFIYQYLKRNNYDLIYLNSITLHSLIKVQLPFVIHIREIYDGSNNKVFSSLNNSKGVLYIDKATKYPFESKIKGPIELMINNPFHQTELKKYEILQSDLKEKYKDKFVFSIIGLIKPTKGQKFIIQSFIQAQIPNSILLIVGGTNDKSYLNECVSLASSYDNIQFLDEESDINKIYLISNCIIRGESIFCVGRTTFEGLYSGCKVILPGSRINNSEELFDYQRFADNIYFYEPRNECDIIEQMKNASISPIMHRNYHSNLVEYATEIKHFFTKLI